MKRTVLLMGPPGSGKDTQAQLLMSRHNYYILNIGEQVRRQARRDASLRADLARGVLANDELVNQIVAHLLNSVSHNQPIVADGFPRRQIQADWFDQYLAEAGRRVELVIYLQLSVSLSLARLQRRQRADDQLAIIQRRLDIFANQSLPVIQFYRQRDIVVEINGDDSIANIHRKIDRCIL